MTDSSPFLNTSQSPWKLWIVFFSSLLLFVSLWVVNSLIWHLGVSAVTLLSLLIYAKDGLRKLKMILVFLAFLVTLQIIFSAYMRELFLRSIVEGFHWSDWRYLLFAAERLAWPLMVVTVFQDELTSPRVASNLSLLLFPLGYLGLNISKLQSLIILSLRFLPSLKSEWERFTYFQTYFSRDQSRSSLIDKLTFTQSVLKAMISHTIQRAVTTGNILSIRGLPASSSNITLKDFTPPGILWIFIGTLMYFLHGTLLVLWIIMSIWLLLTILSLGRRISA